MNEIPAAVTELIEWRQKALQEEKDASLLRDQELADQKFAKLEANSNSVWEALKPFAVRTLNRIKVNAPGLHSFGIELNDNYSLWACEDLFYGVRVPYAPNKGEEAEIVTQMADFLTQLKDAAPPEPEPKRERPFEHYHLFDSYLCTEIETWLNEEVAAGYSLVSVHPYGEGEHSRYVAVTQCGDR